MNELPGYNSDTVSNAICTVTMVTGIVLFKEGYKVEQVEEILKKISDISMAVFEGRAKVTDSGIIFNTNENVIPLK